MNLIGTGKELSYLDFVELASAHNYTVPELRAVVQVEAASYGFDDANRPKILFEPHIFWRELGPGTKRDHAAALGLAYKTWGAKPYPKTSDARYEQLRKAMLIDETAALKSASFGLGQVMGFNYSAAGFVSVQAFVMAMLLGEREQLLAMLSFIDTNNLEDDLQDHRWATFARGYNGAGYAANSYDTKLANAHAQFLINPKAGFTDVTDTNLDPILIRGSTGPAVVEAQTLLVAKGYDIGPKGIDGWYSTDTIAAVNAFQADHPTLLIDGRIGENTWAALRAEDSAAVVQVTPPAPGSQVIVDDEPVVAGTEQPSQPVTTAPVPADSNAGAIAFGIFCIVAVIFAGRKLIVKIWNKLTKKDQING